MGTWTSDKRRSLNSLQPSQFRRRRQITGSGLPPQCKELLLFPRPRSTPPKIHIRIRP